MDKDFSPDPKAPVLVIGAAGTDLVGKLSGDLHMGTSNPAQIRISFGGVGRNVAENLARLGQPVTLLTAVGTDYYGDQLLEHIHQVGINTDYISRSPSNPTGSYLGFINPNGGLLVALDDMRVITEVTSAYIRQHENLFFEASAVFIDANLPKQTLRTVISLAGRAGIPVCADPTSVLLAPRLLPYLKHLALISPNCAEAAVLTGEQITTSRRREALQAAKTLVSQGVGIVIIALAESGVVYGTSETSGHIPAIRTAIVDPTGAGDALTATVLFALLNNIPIDDAVRLGVSAASLTIGKPGAVLTDLSLEKLYDHLVI